MATKSTPKRPAKKAAPKLSQGLKAAFAMAANEVFYEWVSDAVEHPKRLLKSGDLGSSYQGFHGGLLDAEGAAKVLADGLGPWLTPALVTKTLAGAGGGSAADFGCELVDVVTCAAGIEIAEAILLLALGRDAEVKPHFPPVPADHPLARRSIGRDDRGGGHGRGRRDRPAVRLKRGGGPTIEPASDTAPLSCGP